MGGNKVNNLLVQNNQSKEMKAFKCCWDGMLPSDEEIA